MKDRLPAPLISVNGASEIRTVVDKLTGPAPKVARVNKEIGRRSDVVGIFPNDQALIRLAGMACLPLEAWTY